MKKKTISILVMVMSLLISVPAFANEIVPFAPYQKTEYKIDVGTTAWNGKLRKKIWTVSNKAPVRFNVSISDRVYRTVKADFYELNVYYPDLKISGTGWFTSRNNGYTSTKKFYPKKQSNCYAIVYSKDKKGVRGAVSTE